MKKNKTEILDAPVYYTVEQGMLSPRDGSIGWRYWDTFANKPAAMKEARKLYVARVVECKQVFFHQQEVK